MNKQKIKELSNANIKVRQAKLKDNDRALDKYIDKQRIEFYKEWFQYLDAFYK